MIFARSLPPLKPQIVLNGDNTCSYCYSHHSYHTALTGTAHLSHQGHSLSPSPLPTTTPGLTRPFLLQGPCARSESYGWLTVKAISLIRQHGLVDCMLDSFFDPYTTPKRLWTCIRSQRTVPFIATAREYRRSYTYSLSVTELSSPKCCTSDINITVNYDHAQ